MPDDEKMPSQGPQVTTERHLSRHNVMGVFGSLEDARNAIEALGRAGIDGQHITLQGEAADEAAAQTEDVPAADARIMKRWFGTVAAWAVLGGILGAVLGIPVGYAFVEASGRDFTLPTAIGVAFLGALFISAIAGLVAAMYPMQDTEAWELAHHDAYQSTAIVGVHSANANEIATARYVLEGRHALMVRTAGPDEMPREAVRSAGRGA
jgi:hypothetical protein